MVKICMDGSKIGELKKKSHVPQKSREAEI